MVVVPQVTLEKFRFYKCEMSSIGSQSTFPAFLITPALQSEAAGKNPCCILLLPPTGKSTWFVLGQEILSFCLDLQTS